MIVTVIKFSQEFRTYDGPEWRGLEATILPDEDPIECMDKLRHLVSMAGTISGKGEQVKEPYFDKREVFKENRVQMFINEINQCTEIDKLNSFGVQIGLLAFEELAKSDSAILEAYELKLKQLQS